MNLGIKHRPAAHCENGAISALLRYHGVDLSEPMIFGLSSGLFFTHMPFLKMSGMPVTSFRSFPGVIFNRLCKILKIKTHVKRFLRQEQAMKALDNVLIEQKKPVACVVGMYYLPYMPIEYRFHFNGHNICITGKNIEADEYLVLDSNATQEVYISRKDLIKVRFAKGGTYPLMGQMYWIEAVPEQLPDLKKLIFKAIVRNCNNMVSQPKFVKIAGTNGILYLSKRIRTWEMTMGKRRAALNLAHIIRMLEEIGTGGAGFRFLYGAFLQEASSYTGVAELDLFSQKITAIGDMWRRFAFTASRIYKRREGENYTYDDLGDMLENISKSEKEFFTELKAFAKNELKKM